MKKINLITAALALLAFTACCKDDDNNNGGGGEPPVNQRTAVQVSKTTIVGTTPVDVAPGTRGLGTRTDASTRATDAAWEAGDAIGLLMLQTGTATPIDGKLALKYTTATTTGSFQPTDEANTAYYPEGDAAVDILAFYPHAQVGADLKVPVSTADQSKLSGIDLMVADKSTGHSATNPGVSLNFRHKLAKLVVTVDKEASAASIDLAGATLRVSGTAATAKWSLADAQLTEQAAATDITLAATATTDNMSATGIVLPTAAGKGVKLLITTKDGKTYTAPLAANAALAQGTVNTLRVHLSQTGGGATEARIEASITDWVSGLVLDLPIIIDTAGDGGSVSGGDFAPAPGDLMAIATLNLDANLSATYTATAAGADAKAIWTSDAPLNWKNFTAANAPFSFCALITPKAGTDTADGQVKDYLAGRTTGIAYAGIINFTAEGSRLTHAMSQVTVVVKPGSSYTPEQIAGAQVTLHAIRPLTAIATDGTLTLAAATSLPLTRNATDGTYNARIAPQAIAGGVTALTLKLGDKSYSYLTEGSGLTFAPGTLNTLNLTLSSANRVNISFVVAPWAKGFDIDGDIELD